MCFDDGNIAGFVRRKHSIDNIESAVREFHDSGGTLCNDMIVGYYHSILAHQKAAALGNWLAILIRHDDGHDGPTGSLGNRWYVFSKQRRLRSAEA